MIIVTKNLVEGYFIVTIDDLIFEVKGIVHPRDRVIAYLRYVPRKKSDSGYRKVYDLDERENYLQSNHPSYLWFSESHGRTVQSVPNSKIKYILNPVNRLTSLRNRIDEVSDLEKASVELAGKLVESSGIEWSDIGITGSQLVGVAGTDSDIDLVVFGSDICRRFYSKLSENIESIVGVERYTGTILDEHVTFRWGAHESLRSVLRKIEQAKILQGLFRNYHFFVRLVKNSDDLDYVYGDFSYQEKGQQLVSGEIMNNEESIFTPCEYLIECDNLPNIRKLVSYRGRFTEQISEEMFFEALGRLEIVTNHKEKTQFMQLVLGELPTDYLVPK